MERQKVKVTLVACGLAATCPEGNWDQRKSEI